MIDPRRDETLLDRLALVFMGTTMWLLFLWVVATLISSTVR